jgi:ribosomal protein S18 acetylase RimI-like enzyme
VDDIPSVASLLMRSKLAGFPTEERKLRKYIEKSINAFPRGAYIVLVKDDDEEEKSKKCVGVVGVSNTPETRRDDFDRALQFTDDGGYISDLVIDTRCRGRGLGEKLMLCGESLCKEMGREEVYLHVSTRKVGVIRLYENIGYEERSSNFLRRDLLMRKKI